MTLLSRLQDAPVGTRELDAEIDALLFGGLSSKAFTRDTPGGSLRHSYSAGTVFLSDDPMTNGGCVLTSHHRQSDKVTTSLDAALALSERVLPGSMGTVSFGPGISNALLHGPNTAATEAWGNTPALALCAAIIAAKTATTPDDPTPR